MINYLPLVSVIIPLYNAEKYIDKTIASVLNQTYKNIEVIIIDDCSTDGSYEVAKEFEASNIIVTKNKGNGACTARNYGFEKSSGDYIQYLDADDLLSPNKLEKQIAALIIQDDNLVANSSWTRFYENTYDVKWKNQSIDKDYDEPAQWLAESWLGGGMAQTAVWLTPKSLIEEAGPWNEKLKLNQDGEFFCRVLLKSKGITFVKNCGVYYRSGLAYSISKINNKSKEKAESLLHSYQLYKKHVESLAISLNLKTALGNNFLMFMYQYHSLFPDLSNMAEKEFFELGNVRMWPVGGKRFQYLAKIVGFKNALKLKASFKRT